MVSVCQNALITLPSYLDCELYYDFSISSQQLINDSLFTENAFNGDEINGYFDISDSTNIIGSNSEFSFLEYTILLDIQFIFTENQTYFWGADQTPDINNGATNRKQYHFVLLNGYLGIENSVELKLFSGSRKLNTNQRYLIIYKSARKNAELYIDGELQGTQEIYNYGIYSPFYIKLGGVGYMNQSLTEMKIYRYAFYDKLLSDMEIKEMCQQFVPITTEIVDKVIVDGNDGLGAYDMITIELFIIGGILCFLCVIGAIFVFYKHKKDENERDDEEDESDDYSQHGLQNDGDDDDDDYENDINNYNECDNECVICMDKKREYICIPCGHYCLCRNCKNRMKGKCPVCRRKCQIIKVFT